MKSPTLSHPSVPISQGARFFHRRGAQLWLGASGVVWAALILWTFAGPRIRLPSSTPPNAPLILGGITLATALLAHWCRERFTPGKLATPTLPDPLYTLYLATIILAGTPDAVLFAAIAPFVEYAPDLIHRLSHARMTLLRAAIGALTVLLTGLTYVNLWPALAMHTTVLRAHSIAALIACVVLFVGAAFVTSVTSEPRDTPPLRLLWRYFKSPAARFQVLLLCVAPLLPLANLLDVVEAEFAWLLLLLPLGAVYYLALVSVRLQQRSDELQATVRQLEMARRRQAELTDYAALVTHAQEDERLRLARELHDDTAQALIALTRGLDALATRHTEPPLSVYDAHFISELGILSKRTLDSVRRACQDLRPSVLDDLGLPAALESLAYAMSERGLACEARLEGEEQPCAPEVEVTIYRIAQEALSNAMRHAHATTTEVWISYTSAAIALRVTDNGCGFDPMRIEHEEHETSTATQIRNRSASHSGLGLLGMRERAALIGAHLNIWSEPHSGTTVALHVPIA